jgi:LmbE family N-acetylglucosaminyl deacetylase
LALALATSTALAAEPATLALRPDDRVLVLAPHPDDEVIGCAGVLQQALAKHLPVQVVFLTAGDNNQWAFALARRHPVIMPRAVRAMGQVRELEARTAAGVLGVATNNLVFLGYPDFGTLRIWREHWGTDTKPYRSMMTRVTAVPYADALRPGALYKGEEIVRDLRQILTGFRPTQIFLSHPADHNGDHQALYLFTQVALWDLNLHPAPMLHTYLVHFHAWPDPRGPAPEQLLAPPPALQLGPSWTALPLDAAALDRKRSALLAHRTQYRYSGRYLLSFIRANELFGKLLPLRLPSQEPLLIEEASGPRGEPPESLNERQRMARVWVMWKTAAIVDDQLRVVEHISQPLADELRANEFLLGYRHNEPFANMPKLRVEIGPQSHAVFDQRRRLPASRVTVTRDDHTLTVDVPLELLGRPEKLLLSTTTDYNGTMIDQVSWRVLELPGR